MSTAAIAAAAGGASRPHPPTRDEACTIGHHFQGLYIYSETYSPQYGPEYGGPDGGGPLPWFTAALPAMHAAGELDAVLDQLVDAGDTHCQIDLRFNYGESGQPWGSPQLVPDCDLSGDMPTYLAICDRVIARGLKPIFVTPAEGQDGVTWVFNQFAGFVEALRSGYDRLAYGPVQHGYDGTWPASWSPQQTFDVINYSREILGDRAYLALMFGNGPSGSPYLFVQDEGDYVTRLNGLDIVLTTTGPDQAECPSYVNYAQYMLGPNLRPSGVCTPEWHGPYIMEPSSPRGRYFWGTTEWNEYGWVRNRVSGATIQAQRDRMRQCGQTLWG